MIIKRQGIWTSYLIGAPIGLFTVFMAFSIPVILTGEGLATIVMIGIYGKAIVGLIFSFLIALGIAGHLATNDIENKKNLIKTSFKYSLTINFITWIVFIVLTIADNYGKDLLLYLIPPIIAFFVCTTITTFTLGLLICYIIKQKLKTLAA